MARVNWGVIGAGGISVNRTIPGIMQSASSSLKAVNRRNKEKLIEIQKKFNVDNIYNDAGDLVNDGNIDAIYIASPVKYHLEHALLAIDAKIPILIEKPIGKNANEVEQIYEACLKNGVFFDAMLMMQHHSIHELMRQMIIDGKIGDLVTMRMDFCFWYSPEPSAWRLHKDIGGGGVFMDLGPHMLDLVQFVTNRDIVDVHAFTDTLTFSYEVEDSATVILSLENGGHALISAHFNIPDDIAANKFEVYGTEGVLIAEGTIGQEEKGRLLYKRTGQAEYEEITKSEGNLYTKKIDAFINLMNDQSKWEETMHKQIDLQKIIDKVYAK